MASFNERASTPGTIFCGILPRNGFCALLPVMAAGNCVVPAIGNEKLEVAPLSTFTVCPRAGAMRMKALDRATAILQTARVHPVWVILLHHGRSLALPFSSTLTMVLPLPQQCRPGRLFSGISLPGWCAHRSRSAG